MGTAAPATGMIPTADLEAAIAELPAKKDALREAFDSLAACSPYPLPFTWEALDAHVSSVQSSISQRFRQLRVLEAAHPGKNREGTNKEEEEEEEEEEGEEEEEQEGEEEEEEEGEEEEEQGEEEEEEEEEGEEEEEEEEEEVDGNISNEAEDDKECGQDEKWDADEEAVTVKVAAGQGKETEGEEQLDQYAQGVGEEQDTEEEEMVKKLTNKQLRRLPPDGWKEFVAACERMDAGTLVKFVINFSIINKKLLVALRHAPDPAALVLQVVKLFLSGKKFECSKVWQNCVKLIRWLSMASAKPSVDTREQAKLVANDWKEMIRRPECCGELDSADPWGLLHFLISYNIAHEFNIHEIISIFAMLPRKLQKKNTIKLCEDLGLADRATDLIDYMIGNGRHLEVFHLAQVFNLEKKYPLFSILKGFIEKAKQTSAEMFRKNEKWKSLNLATPQDLWTAHHLAEQKLVDSRQRSAIVAEIKYLKTEYAKKRMSANSSTPSTSYSRHQPKNRKRRNKKRKKEEQEHHEGQNNQLQQEQNEIKLIQGKQHRLHQQENKRQMTEQQHMKPPRPATLNLPTPAIPPVLNAGQIQNSATLKLPTPAIPLALNAGQIQNFGHPPYATMPGVHNYLAQPCWPGAQGSPLLPQLRPPQYMGPPFNPFALHPWFHPR